MANYCDSSYRIVGEKHEIEALHELMQKLSKEKENGNWVGYIVEVLNNGEIPGGLYVAGWWSELKKGDDFIAFAQESKWEPIYQAWDFICSKFETLSVYFMGEEEGCEVFLKRDDEFGSYFPDNYYLDAVTPQGDYVHEYFRTIDEAFRFIETLEDENIITAEDIESLNLKWGEDDEDAYIYLHEYKEV